MEPLSVREDRPSDLEVLLREDDTNDDEQEIKSSQEGIITDWREIRANTLITGLSHIDYTMMNEGAFAYFEKLDKTATQQQFGTNQSLANLSGMLAKMAFTLWCYRSGAVRVPVIAGRCIAIVACALYLLVELSPTHLVQYLLLCYVLSAVGLGTSPLQRSQIARHSSSAERARAYTLFGSSSLLAGIFGSCIQPALRLLPYPGIELLPSIRLHMFSASIWMRLLANVATIGVAAFLVHDNARPALQESELSLLSSTWKRLRAVAAMPLPWSLILLCIVTRMALIAVVFAVLGTFAAMMISSYGESHEDATMVSALTNIGFSSIALTISLLLYFRRSFAERLDSRALVLFAILVKASGLLALYPWTPFAVPMASFNASTGIGCDPSKYAWCLDGAAPPRTLYPIVVAITFGFAWVPGTMALDTIYSKLLVGIDQNIMQGAIMLAEDATTICTPFAASTIFQYYGLKSISLVSSGFLFANGVVWLYFMPRMKAFL